MRCTANGELAAARGAGAGSGAAGGASCGLSRIRRWRKERGRFDSRWLISTLQADRRRDLGDELDAIGAG